MYFSFKIKVPRIIENILIFLLVKYRKHKYGYGFMRIKLITNESVDEKYQYAIIDPEDWQKLARYPWQLYETERNSRAVVRYYGKKIIYMHRQIMNAPKGSIVDHKNRDSLDNTKRNLRFATPSQNCCNSRRRQKSSSKYRGVRFEKDKNKRNWRAEINYNGMRKHLGYFDNEEDAARAYDEAAKIYHGDFAVLNFP